jgi:hypothetical protein
LRGLLQQVFGPSEQDAASFGRYDAPRSGWSCFHLLITPANEQIRRAPVPTRYYFHLARGQQRLFDRFGAVLSEEAVMSPAALDVAKEIWPGVSDSREWAGWSIEIVDPDGRVVRVIALAE